MVYNNVFEKFVGYVERNIEGESVQKAITENEYLNDLELKKHTVNTTIFNVEEFEAVYNYIQEYYQLNLVADNLAVAYEVYLINDYRYITDLDDFARDYIREIMNRSQYEAIEHYMNFEELGEDLVSNWDFYEFDGLYLEFFDESGIQNIVNWLDYKII